MFLFDVLDLFLQLCWTFAFLQKNISFSTQDFSVKAHTFELYNVKNPTKVSKPTVMYWYYQNAKVKICGLVGVNHIEEYITPYCLCHFLNNCINCTESKKTLYPQPL